MRGLGGRRGRQRALERRETRRGPRNPRAQRLAKLREERRRRRADAVDRGLAPDPSFTGVTLRAGDIAAAVVLFGGLLLIAMPQHGGTIVRLVLVGLAAAAALHAISVLVPEGSVSGWWRSPFDPAAGRQPHVRPSGELERMRKRMSGRRQRIPRGRPLPPETVRLLQPLIAAALERAGLDITDHLTDRAQRPAIRRRLAPLTWAVLNGDPLYLPRWHQTRRPDARRVADVVHRVLDDLERLAADGSDVGPRAPSPPPRAT